MAFAWTKDLETGNALIDSEHKQLIDALNQLLAACSQGQGRTKLESTMKFMSDYTKKHFSDEEQLQMKYRYPDFPNHKKYHETFKGVVAGLMEELRQQGPTVALVGKVNISMGNWLVNHIKSEDVKVAAHIRAAEQKK